MSKPNQFTAQQFIDQIPGSSGIISTIAKRVGCSWEIAKKYIDNYPTIKAAFEAERESLLDIAESVLANNIKLSLQQQQSGKVTADSTDAKWVLSRLGKHRGFAERQEIVGADDGPVILKVVYDDKRTDDPAKEAASSPD